MSRPPGDETVLTRKIYNKPRLQVYGNLSEITQAVGANAKLDGMTTPNGRVQLHTRA